jgi:hypothetical protein
MATAGGLAGEVHFPRSRKEAVRVHEFYPLHLVFLDPTHAVRRAGPAYSARQNRAVGAPICLLDLVPPIRPLLYCGPRNGAVFFAARLRNEILLHSLQTVKQFYTRGYKAVRTA